MGFLDFFKPKEKKNAEPENVSGEQTPSGLEDFKKSF
jgi:hypothetical protein